MVNIVCNTNSVLNHFIAEIRDAEIQKDRMRFRYNVERIGTIFAYELSKVLKYESREVVTPLGIADVSDLAEFPVLAAVLRAGLPFHKGFLDVFDKSENAFVSIYRKLHKDHSFSVQLDYSSCPDITGKVLVLCDTMIATGASIVMSYKDLLSYGKPSHTHIACVLASTEGVNYMKKHLPQQDVTIWVGHIDEEMTAQSYIVPGLGDAGDLAYGHKS